MGRSLTVRDSLRTLRRGQIIAAARQIVGRDGLEALTFASLEAALGFSRGVITYHFADKDEIIEEVLRSAVAEIDKATTDEVKVANTLEGKVLAVLRTKVHGFLRSPEASRVLVAFWGRLASDPRGRALTAGLFAGYRSQGAGLARFAQPKLPKARAEAMGALFVGVVLGLVIMLVIEPQAFEIELAMGEAAAAFARRLQGG